MHGKFVGAIDLLELLISIALMNGAMREKKHWDMGWKTWIQFYNFLHEVGNYQASLNSVLIGKMKPQKVLRPMAVKTKKTDDQKINK